METPSLANDEKTAAPSSEGEAPSPNSPPEAKHEAVNNEQEDDDSESQEVHVEEEGQPPDDEQVEAVEDEPHIETDESKNDISDDATETLNQLSASVEEEDLFGDDPFEFPGAREDDSEQNKNSESDRIAALQKEIENLRQENERQRHECEDSQQQQKNLEETLGTQTSDHAQEIAKLKEALQQKTDSQGDTSTACEQQNDISALQTENEELKKRVNDLESINEDCSALITKLKLKMTTSKEQFRAAAQKHTQQKTVDIKKLHEDFSVISQKQKKAFDQSQTRLKNAIKKGKQIQSDLIESRKTLSASKAAIQQKDIKAAKLEEKLSAKENEHKTLSTSHDDLEILHQDLETKLNELKEQYQQVQGVVQEKTRKEELEHQMECYIEAQDGYNGQLLKCNTTYPGESSTQWFRSFTTSFSSIPGACQPEYTPTADDIGAFLKAEVTSIEFADCKSSTEIGPIRLNPALAAKIKEKLDPLTAEFKVEPLPPNKNTKIILLNKEKIKVREGRKTKMKEVWNPGMKVTLSGDSDRQFDVRLSDRRQELTYLAENAETRDLIALTIRAFQIKNMANEENSYLEFLIRNANERSTSDDVSMLNFNEDSQRMSVNDRRSSLSANVELRVPHRRPSMSESRQSRSIGGLQVVSENPNLDHSNYSPPATPKSVDRSVDRKSSATPRTPLPEGVTIDKDGIRRDGDGYIIRDEEPHPFQMDGMDLSGSDEETEKPVVLKPITFTDEVKEISMEDLKSKASAFKRPPKSTSSKSKTNYRRRGQPSSLKREREKRPSSPRSRKSGHTRRRSNAHHSRARSLSRDKSPRARSKSPSGHGGTGHRRKGSHNAVHQHQPSVSSSSNRIVATLTENLHVRSNAGTTKECSLVGELALAMEPSPANDSIFKFKIGNVAKLGKVVMNQQFLASIAAGEYSATLTAGIAKMIVLRYKADVDPGTSPLTVLPSWEYHEDTKLCDLDIEYTNNIDKPLNSIRFVCGFEAPDEEESNEPHITGVESSSPEARWNSKGQKLAWQFAKLPEDDQKSGHLTATFQTLSRPAPEAIVVTFAAETKVSGIELINSTGEGEPGAAQAAEGDPKPVYELHRVQTIVKAKYIVQ